MATPSRNEFVKSRLRFAQAWAEAEWEVQYGRPQRARETARAWIGIIRLSTMGAVEGYTRAHGGQPYDSPKVGVAPAAPEIVIDVEWFHTTFLPAGTVYHYPYAHEGIVAFQLGVRNAPNEIVGRSRDWDRPCSVCLKDDRVLLAWHELGLIFPDPKYPPPAHFRLLRVDEKREHEIERLSSSVVRVFPTQDAAQSWAETRAAQLKTKHDRNHARQCRDKICAKRGHTYIPRHDED